jgi:hypothetical protein
MRQHLTKHFVNLPRRGLASDALVLGSVGMILPRVGMALRGVATA